MYCYALKETDKKPPAQQGLPIPLYKYFISLPLAFSTMQYEISIHNCINSGATSKAFL